MHIGRWTKKDEVNEKLIEEMEEKGEIAYGLVNNNRAITLNMLIDFCKQQNIDFDKPVFLECPDGYFPLANYHNGVAYDSENNEYSLGVLVIEDGEW